MLFCDGSRGTNLDEIGRINEKFTLRVDDTRPRLAEMVQVIRVLEGI